MLTDIDIVQLSRQAQSQPQPQPEPQARSYAQAIRGYGLSPDKDWIRWDGHNVLWLPPDFRPFKPAKSPSTETIALACHSGRVVLIGFLATGLSPY